MSLTNETIREEDPAGAGVPTRTLLIGPDPGPCHLIGQSQSADPDELQ